MAVIDLPTVPAPRAITPRVVSKGGDLLPTLAGVDVTYNRLGDKWGITFDLPPMTHAHAMVWAARLSRGMHGSIRIALPQPGFVMPPYGAPKVNGAGQAGTTLLIDGVTNGQPVREGQWASFIIGGRSFLYQIAATQTPGGGSSITSLSLWPMLRRSPADNSDVNLSAPIIEGRLEGRVAEWTVDVMMANGLSFTIIERE